MPDDPIAVIVELPTEKKMAVDLPEGILTELLLDSVNNAKVATQTGRDTTVLAGGVLKAAMARNFDELGTVEGRSTSGVLATPIASPTTQAGA